MDLSNTTAFVSGANRGPGKQLAEQLINRGTRVYSGVRNPAPPAPALALAPIPVHLGITDPVSASTASDTTLLFNNAGVANVTAEWAAGLSNPVIWHMPESLQPLHDLYGPQNWSGCPWPIRGPM
jgi:NAD(P)-dependent dehydrogenase (short-subunit alcohol dehydrogenase family)